MDNSNLNDRKLIALIRVSKRHQAKKGLPQQTAWLRSFADDNKMVWVDDRQEALAVSQTRKRPDIEYLLARKRLKGDFDTVLVQDLSRLTRGGLEHGFDIYKAFKQHGILICSVVDGLIDSEEKLEAALRKFKEARAAMRLNAMSIARGQHSSRKENRSVPTKQVPFGLDRMIIGEDGNPLYVLRNLYDGRQQQLDASTLKQIRIFPKNEPGVWRHYVRQEGERVTLVRGSDEAVAIVRHIFRRKFVDGWGLSRLTRELNDRGYRAPKGGTWSRSTVRSIYTNTVYLGKVIGNRQGTGEYWFLGTESGAPMPQSEQIMNPNQSNWINSHRGEEFWQWFEFPNLKTYLDTGLAGFPKPCLDSVTKASVERFQFDEMRRLARHQTVNRGGDKHVQSKFILKGLLRSRDGNEIMTGRTFTTNGVFHRYYAVSRARSNPSSHTMLHRLIPAEPLEAEVLRTIAIAIGSYDGLQKAVEQALKAQADQANDQAASMRKSKLERDQLVRQIDFWIKQVSDLGEAVVTAQIQPLKARASKLEQQISQPLPASPSLNAVSVTATIRKRFQEFLKATRVSDRESLRRLLPLLIRRMTVDLETREVDLVVGVPSWTLHTDDFAGGTHCLDNTNLKIIVCEAVGDWSIPIADFVCDHVKKFKNLHWCCRRQGGSKQSEKSTSRGTGPSMRIQRPKAA